MKKVIKFKKTENGIEMKNSKYFSKQDNIEINFLLEGRLFESIKDKFDIYDETFDSFSIKYIKAKEIINLISYRPFFLDENHNFSSEYMDSLAELFRNIRSLNSEPMIITQKIYDLPKNYFF